MTAAQAALIGCIAVALAHMIVEVCRLRRRAKGKPSREDQ
jgi:hypothetical protein